MKEGRGHRKKEQRKERREEQKKKINLVMGKLIVLIAVTISQYTSNHYIAYFKYVHIYVLYIHKIYLL